MFEFIKNTQTSKTGKKKTPQLVINKEYVRLIYWFWRFPTYISWVSLK